jgi:eukaryotic-like serine/threonine-protein kinase
MHAGCNSWEHGEAAAEGSGAWRCGMAENVEEAATRRRRRSRRSTSQSLELTGEPAGPRAALPRPGDVIAGKYRIEALLGRGGMGAVYTATHLVSEKRVAVKWMLPVQGHSAELSERFIREARATARIDHPNVVDIYDVGEHEGSVYLVMELLHGETLAQRLDRAPIEPAEAAALLMPALRAVAAAHAQGVIHRDLKPDNIFLCSSKEGELREVKVLDFGISKIAADDQRDMAMTASGMVMGTPYYMSPEQIRGLKEVDARGDVYAFGVILYEMLGDCYPFDADTYNALILKIATTDPAPLQQIDPELDSGLVEVVMRAMARELDARYQSIDELGAALEQYAGGVTFRLSNTPQRALSMPTPIAPVRVSRQATTGATERREDLAKPDGRPKLVAAGVAGAVLMLVVLALLAMRSGSSERAVAHEGSGEPGAHEVEPAPLVGAAPGAGPVASPPTVAPAAEAAPAAVEPLPLEHTAPKVAGPAGARPSRRPGRAVESATSAPAAPEAPKSPSRPSLPSDWDERLIQVPARPVKPAPPAKTAAGRLSSDDL